MWQHSHFHVSFLKGQMLNSFALSTSLVPNLMKSCIPLWHYFLPGQEHLWKADIIKTCSDNCQPFKHQLLSEVNGFCCSRHTVNDCTALKSLQDWRSESCPCGLTHGLVLLMHAGLLKTIGVLQSCIRRKAANRVFLWRHVFKKKKEWCLILDQTSSNILYCTILHHDLVTQDAKTTYLSKTVT